MKKNIKIKGLTKTFTLRCFVFILLAVLLVQCGEEGPKFHFDMETGESNIEELDANLTEEQKQKLGGSLGMAMFFLEARKHFEDTGNCPSLFNSKSGGRDQWLHVVEKMEGKTVEQIISMTEKAIAEMEKECD